MELGQDTEIEEVYRKLFAGGFQESEQVSEKTVRGYVTSVKTDSIRDYITDMKTDTLRGEMDYFVSYCLEFGVNLSRIARMGDGFTYDYYTFAEEKLCHAGMVMATSMALYPHRHDYYELVYVLSGRLKHHIADQELILKFN